jgi:thiol-disulfide isomerase/thioredoxin
MNRAASRSFWAFLALGSALVAATAVATHATPRTAGDGPESFEGKPAPEVSLKTLDGKDFKLSALKGNVVLVDYWATWCPPCRASLPHINELANDKDLTAKGLSVFAVDNGEAAGDVKAFVTLNKYTFPVVLDPEAQLGKTYGVTGIPTTLLIGRDGTVKKVFVGFDPASTPGEMTAKIKELLAEPAPAK